MMWQENSPCTKTLSSSQIQTKYVWWTKGPKNPMSFNNLINRVLIHKGSAEIGEQVAGYIIL